jgi:hypothetical protein
LGGGERQKGGTEREGTKDRKGGEYRQGGVRCSLAVGGRLCPWALVVRRDALGVVLVSGGLLRPWALAFVGGCRVGGRSPCALALVGGRRVGGLFSSVGGCCVRGHSRSWVGVVLGVVVSLTLVGAWGVVLHGRSSWVGIALGIILVGGGLLHPWAVLAVGVFVVHGRVSS